MNGFDKLMVLKLEHLFGISKEDILSEELNMIEESDAMLEEIPE